MNRISVFFGLSLSILTLNAAPTLNVVHFNEGWPSAGESIPNLPNVSSITSTGMYSFAIGLMSDNTMAVAYFDGANWHQATNIGNLKGISAVIPLFENGATSQAFALGVNNQVAYFDGNTWNPAAMANNLQNITLLSTAGHAFAISTSAPIQSSFFDVANQTWSTPVNLSNSLATIRASVAANGEIYLLGLNSNGQLTAMQSSNNQDWATQVFNITRPYLMEIAAGGTDVLVGAESGEGTFFNYSIDQGHAWHTATWPGGLLFHKINQDIAWDMTDNGELAYFNMQSPNPTWVTVPIPAQVGRVQTYANPSLDGLQFCVVGSEDDSPPQLACYNEADQRWQMISSLNEVASRLDEIALLNQNQLAAFGADINGKSALFYYNGASWQVTHPQGLTALVQNLYLSGPPANLWATGHN